MVSLLVADANIFNAAKILDEVGSCVGLVWGTLALWNTTDL